MQVVAGAGGSDFRYEFRRSGDKPVFILDGEELVGAKQNRVVNLSILVPASTTVTVPVSCVEAGRWRAKSRTFKSAPRTQYATGRAKRVAQVTYNLKASGSRHSDQAEVWSDIAMMSRKLEAESPTAAMEEMLGPEPKELPLAQAGPAGNGFWGTCVFLLIMATALTTFVASYFYLGGNVVPQLRGSPAEPIGRPAVALGLLALGLIPVVAAVRAIGRRRLTPLRLGVTAALLLGAAHLGLLLATWSDSGLSPATDGQHSAFVGVALFHGVLSAIGLVMMAVATIWAWLSPADPRGHAVAWNAALVYGFTLASNVIVFGVLYLVPRFG